MATGSAYHGWKLPWAVFLIAYICVQSTWLRKLGASRDTLLIDNAMLSPPTASRHLRYDTEMSQQSMKAQGNGIETWESWFDKSEWDNNQVLQASCHYVEDVCTSAGKMFYDSNVMSEQPYPFSILTKWTRRQAVHDTLPAGYPSSIGILRDIPSENLLCTYSRIPNHMSLFSVFDHMLGEFYVRVLMGFYDLFHTLGETKKTVNGTSTTDASKFLRQFRETTQLYLQLDQGKSQLLDSHQLFLGLFSNSPPSHFKTLLDSPSCTCMKRLFFCGYKKDEKLDADSGAVATTLQPEAFVGPIPYHKGGTNDGTQHASRLRQFILDQIVGNNLVTRERIEERRIENIHAAIRTKTISGMDSSSTNSSKYPLTDDIQPNEWKIVGLAQREGRRRWLGLDIAIARCNQRFIPQRIICVEVNIEKEEFSSPMQHVLAYAGLDALIGIHGAQLTEALLMPSGALVVELLPWIFPGIEWGQWTQWVHRPTPLGVLFSESSLNHIGYPLIRKSAKNYCRRESFNGRCFSRIPNGWDNRDFHVETEVLHELVDRFVASQSLTCKHFLDHAKDEYVLYNVNCVNTTEGNQSEHHHFYRSEDWIVNKTYWSIEDELWLYS